MHDKVKDKGSENKDCQGRHDKSWISPKKDAGGMIADKSFHGQVTTWMIQFVGVTPPRC